MAVPCLVSNSAAHPWVVQKFGGTSVGKFPDKVGFTSSVSFWCLASCACHACTVVPCCSLYIISASGL